MCNCNIQQYVLICIVQNSGRLVFCCGWSAQMDTSTGLRLCWGNQQGFASEMVSLFLLSIPPSYTQMHVRVHKPYLHASMGHSTCAGVLRCSSPPGVRINCLQTRRQQSTIYQSKFVPPTLLHTEYTRLVSTVDILTQYYLATSCPYLWAFIVQTTKSNT